MNSKSIFILTGTILVSLALGGCAQIVPDSTHANLNATNHLAGLLKNIPKNSRALDFSIKPTKTGLITTCKGDEPAICDILAKACKELGGVGQCGGNANPTGCQCET